MQIVEMMGLWQMCSDLISEVEVILKGVSQHITLH